MSQQAFPYLDPEHHRRRIEVISSEEELEHYKRFTMDFVSDSATVTNEQYMSLYQQGFLPEKIFLYGLDANDPAPYLDDFQRWLTQSINGEFAIVFNNKVLFTQVFRNFCKVPGVTAIWRSGRIIVYDELWNNIKNGLLKVPVRLVAKPLGGGGGGNVYFIRANSSSVVVESNDAEEKRRSLPVAQIDRIFENHSVPFMVTEYIQQGRFTQELYPLTVNTVRVLIIRDPDSLQPYVVRAVQRIGTSSSYPIDNFTYGGLSAYIDMKTGVLGKAIPAAGPYAGKFMETHPDTGEQITGRVIPRWQETISQIKELFLRIPYVSYCGFDIILQDDGFVVLEGNSFSQVRLFQMHAPLLNDPVYRKFLRHYGIYSDSKTILLGKEAEK